MYRRSLFVQMGRYKEAEELLLHALEMDRSLGEQSAEASPVPSPSPSAHSAFRGHFSETISAPISHARFVPPCGGPATAAGGRAAAAARQAALGLHSLAEMLRGFVSACHSVSRRHK